ncbi:MULTISPECIES: O-antigen ligase family protein [Vibrio]|uniref:O-antigen ligase family protein n=1 Tax=Vibrio TaxID=662 RepID=UPI002075BA17|nr:MULTISPECIES: O-antigen ligase family protein [Vibrio]USD32697.1 O-antigen ligase family protein [Vibrio sp. SCSIO 43186]USD45737.1 O-antigen ligase family protein [Vibrio sp. SCSIO 43145]USD69822.1 O-antigen ligase family protein [Vibrio sp. SCSIO 43139]USD94727.1 O-antigen ligase [Vibrio coralliilyticus]
MKNAVQQLEKVFLFSPTFLVLISIFNFIDTKYLVSRATVIVIIYSVVRYRQHIKVNFEQNNYKKFFLASILTFTYCSFMYVLRGDNFGLPRTLITCLIYLSVIPWSKFSRAWVYNTIIFSAYVCGLNAIFEHYYLNVARVGMATNPIPYALYCSFLSLSSLVLAKRYTSRIIQSLCIIGFVLSLWALVLTDTRGVWVAYPIVMMFVMYRSFNTLSFVKIGALTLIGLNVVYFSFKPMINERIDRTVAEFNSISKGNYETSIGARLALWELGADIWIEVPIAGAGDVVLEKKISEVPNRVAYRQPHLHNQYIDTFARYGFVGLLIMMIWLFYPIKLNKAKEEENVITQVLIMLLFIAGLSDVPFHHTHVVYLFTLVVGLFSMNQMDSRSS